ncbi:MAG: hypothetical protein QNL87_07210, partial [Gammaproteobacteria bacterium]|nr:hypothetical protein [Gammaproteobacteria bacterium]
MLVAQSQIKSIAFGRFGISLFILDIFIFSRQLPFPAPSPGKSWPHPEKIPIPYVPVEGCIGYGFRIGIFYRQAGAQ